MECGDVVAEGVVMIWTALALAAASAAGPWDKYVSISPLEGHALAAECSQRSDLGWDPCVGYVLGVSDVLSIDRKMCLNSNGRTAQIVAIVRKHLRDHPEQWNKHPFELVRAPLTAAFPCK